MIGLGDFVAQFQRLRRAPNRSFPAESLHKAPHKPLLLLALMDLIQANVITTPFVDIRGDLDQLNDLFCDYWKALLSQNCTSSIAFPFSRLNGEPFWELVSIDGNAISDRVINGITSVNQLRSVAIGARIHGDLFGYLVAPESREVLTNAILESCFSHEGQRIMSSTIATHRGSFQYEMFLEEKARKPDLKEPRLTGNYSEARDRGFRQAIVKNYDKRCALCGVKIVTPEGRCVVDAAHIVPWSKSRDDSIGNGIALCKLCHWAFDNGLIGISGGYKIILSAQISIHPNAAGLLITLNHRDILGPTERMSWPDHQNLAWHHSHWSL